VLPEIFKDSVWQMSLGERAAVEGLLTQLKPDLAIEIGSMEGASLRRIAAHAKEVHSFDLNPPTLAVPENVTLHTGDSHELLPAFLAELTEEGRNVDFVMVDGDHSSEGVRRDLEDLLNSRALRRTVILIHDTANELVRSGVDAVHFPAWPKVAHVELDFVPGQLFSEPALRNELWCGLGLVVVDASRLAYQNGAVYQQRYYPAASLLADARDLVLARERAPAGAAAPEADLEAAKGRIALLEAELGDSVLWRAEVDALRSEVAVSRKRLPALEAQVEALRINYERCQRALEDIKASASWRMTEPLRSAKRKVRPEAR
jgi:Methyltransferase domain